MGTIKKIDEFASTYKNELESIQKSVVYKTYYPKSNQSDYNYIRDNRQALWDFFNNGYKYANLKEFRSCVNPKSLWKNTFCLKVALLDNIMIAASIYTSYQKGIKCVGITATTNTEYRNIGKQAVIHIVKEDIKHVGEFYWTECSDAIEHLYEKHGGVKIPNDYIGLFVKKYKSLSDDGYHFFVETTDSDGETEDVKKVIFGFNSKETFEYIKSKNDKRIMTYIDRITNIAIKESVYVKELSKEDYYTEVVYVFYEDRIDGNKDYSNETLNVLREAVNYLKKFIIQNKNNANVDIAKYADAVENGDTLISTTTVMSLHNDILL